MEARGDPSIQPRSGVDGAAGEIAPQLMKWGYQLPGTLVINARAETAAEKPLFRESVKARRCLIRPRAFMSGMLESESISLHFRGSAALSIWQDCMTTGTERTATAS